MKLWQALWADEHGFIISTELALLATVGVIGLTAGLVCVRDAVSSELTDVADAIGSLNQSYCYTGFSAASPRCCKSRTAGSCFVDHEEATYREDIDIQGGAVIEGNATLTPTPAVEQQVIEQDVVEESVVEEQVVEPRVIESVGPCDETPCDGAEVLDSKVIVPCEQGCHEATPCTSAAPCDACGNAVQHAPPVSADVTAHKIDADGVVWGGTSTHPAPFRILDPVDAIHRPQVTPRIGMW